MGGSKVLRFVTDLVVSKTKTVEVFPHSPVRRNPARPSAVPAGARFGPSAIGLKMTLPRSSGSWPSPSPSSTIHVPPVYGPTCTGEHANKRNALIASYPSE